MLLLATPNVRACGFPPSVLAPATLVPMQLDVDVSARLAQNEITRTLLSVSTRPNCPSNVQARAHTC